MLEQTPAELESLLDRLATVGSAAWPTLALDRADFLAFLRQRVVGLTRERVEMLPAADLYMACACVHRVDGAAELFYQAYLAPLPVGLERMRIPAMVAHDVQGVLFERVVTPRRNDPNGRTLLADYAGTGELRSWLHIVAAREAFRIMRKATRATQPPPNMLDVIPVVEQDAEIQYLKATYQQELQDSFQEAAAALSARERNILRYSYLDGLSIDEIGALYQVHRATAARWVTAAEAKLAEQTRAALMQRLRLTGQDVESVLRLIRSQLDFSVRRHLDRATEAE